MTTAAEYIKILEDTFKNKNIAKTGNNIDGGAWPTGIIPFDAVLDGGFAKGRMALLAGESATLKSMVGLTTAASVQRAGGTAALIDCEHAFNPDWARKVGVNPDELLVSRPGTAEEVIDQMEVLIRNDIDYICMDSIPSMLPRAERDIMLSGKDHVQPARIAALMSLGLRRLNAANDKTTIVWITQLRDNLGAMAFSPKTITTGGKAKDYYPSQSLMLRKAGQIRQDVRYFDGEKDSLDKQTVGQKFKVELTKSRLGQPFRVQFFNYDLHEGRIDQTQYLIQQGMDMGYITKNGAMWEMGLADANGEIIAELKSRGKDNFKAELSADEEAHTHLLNTIAARYQLNPENYKW